MGGLSVRRWVRLAPLIVVCNGAFKEVPFIMSFVMFVAAWRERAPTGIPIEFVHGCFDRQLEKEEDHWRFQTSAIYCTPFILDDDCDFSASSTIYDRHMVSRMLIDRPTDDLLVCVFRLLANPHCVLYWPGSRICSRHESVVGHVPIDMLATLGPCLILSDVTDIHRHLRET